MKKQIVVGALVASAFLLGAGAAAPAMAADNLVTNGTFDGAGYTTNNGLYLVGQNFGGWQMKTKLVNSEGTLQVWYPEMEGVGPAQAAPFINGPWVGITGTIAQSFPTVVGKSYSVTYDTRASGRVAAATTPGWKGGNPGAVSINGVTADTFTTVKDPVSSAHIFVFTASSTTTELSFNLVNNAAVGLDNVSVTLVPENDSPIMLPAIAGGLGVAALGAGAALIGRKNKRASA
ncbi:hypothetical protein [Leifsonia kafniensis]